MVSCSCRCFSVSILIVPVVVPFEEVVVPRVWCVSRSTVVTWVIPLIWILVDYRGETIKLLGDPLARRGSTVRSIGSRSCWNDLGTWLVSCRSRKSVVVGSTPVSRSWFGPWLVVVLVSPRLCGLLGGWIGHPLGPGRMSREWRMFLWLWAPNMCPNWRHSIDCVGSSCKRNGNVRYILMRKNCDMFCLIKITNFLVVDYLCGVKLCDTLILFTYVSPPYLKGIAFNFKKP